MPLTSVFFCNSKKTSAGFTLLELLITLTIASILFGVAIPSFFAAIRSNRLTANANQLVSALNYARSEAVKRGVAITIRRVDDKSSTNLGAAANWEDGWDVFLDADANGEFEAGGVVLKTFPGLQTNYTLRGNANLTAFIRFMADGRANAAGYLVLCENSDNNATPEANTSRVIEVNTIGRVSMGMDSNNNQIPERFDPVATNYRVDITTCQP